MTDRSTEPAWMPIESAPKDATVQVVIEATEAHPYGGRIKPVTCPAYIDSDGVICCSGTWKPDPGIRAGMFRATLWQPLATPPTGDAP